LIDDNVIDKIRESVLKDGHFESDFIGNSMAENCRRITTDGYDITIDLDSKALEINQLSPTLKLMLLIDSDGNISMMNDDIDTILLVINEELYEKQS